MTWILFSLASAGFESIKDAFGKTSSSRTNEHTAAFMLHVGTFVFTLPLICWFGIPKLTPEFWWGSLAFIPLTPLWSILYMRALKLAPLSTILPLMAINPIFTLIIASTINHTLPSLLSIVGILAISSGIYLANFNPANNGKQQSWFSPFLALCKNQAAQAMLVVSLLWSFGAIFSKWRVNGSDAPFATFTGAAIGLVTTWLIALLVRRPITFNQLRANGKQLFGMSFGYFLASYASSLALVNGPAEYIFAIKRGSLIGSSVLGVLLFKEKLNWYKTVGILVVAIGIACLAMGNRG